MSCFFLDDVIIRGVMQELVFGMNFLLNEWETRIGNC
jgi:hypothetical protein